MEHTNKKMEEELNLLKKEVVQDEAKIAQEEKEIRKLKFSTKALTVVILLVLALGGAVLTYLSYSNRTVYIEKSDIEAPEISLTASTGGILNEMLVKEGDQVAANEIVARVGDQLIKTKVAGIITKANAVVGQSYAPSQPVVAMIDSAQLRVVGHLDENKGLDRVRVGQYAVFTVDTFGSKEYSGIIDSISPIARSGDIVFTISDKRQEQVFDVKVRFDTTLYPELKNGMSARIWVSQ